MKTSSPADSLNLPNRRRRAGWLLPVFLLLAGCSESPNAGYQGYLEGEFVYVASPIAGQLNTLSVARGDHVAAGDALFTLERTAEQAALAEAEARLAAAEARLADLQKGSRPSELEVIESQLAQARASATLSARELERRETIFAAGALSASDFEQAQLNHERNLRRVDELTAQLTTSRLGGRDDAVVAAQAEVASARAARDRAAWNVEQKSQSAPAAGLIQDTLYRAGEFVPAANPVVVLLPPDNVKVRFFVPEADFAALNAGDPVEVSVTGRDPVPGRITYLSTQPEFTPPVLYNRENRAKLVFRVEATLERGTVELHPGQPATVTVTQP